MDRKHRRKIDNERTRLTNTFITFKKSIVLL